MGVLRSSIDAACWMVMTDHPVAETHHSFRLCHGSLYKFYRYQNTDFPWHCVHGLHTMPYLQTGIRESCNVPADGSLLLSSLLLVKRKTC
jgi:hypothetical protein